MVIQTVAHDPYNILEESKQQGGGSNKLSHSNTTVQMGGYYKNKNKVYNKLPTSDSVFRNTDNVINQQSKNNNINIKQLKKRFFPITIQHFLTLL